MACNRTGKSTITSFLSTHCTRCTAFHGLHFGYFHLLAGEWHHRDNTSYFPTKCTRCQFCKPLPQSDLQHRGGHLPEGGNFEAGVACGNARSISSAGKPTPKVGTRSIPILRSAAGPTIKAAPQSGCKEGYKKRIQMSVGKPGGLKPLYNQFILICVRQGIFQQCFQLLRPLPANINTSVRGDGTTHHPLSGIEAGQALLDCRFEKFAAYSSHSPL